MRLNQLVLFISKCPEEYTGAKHIEMPESGGSIGRAAGCTVSLADHNRFISSTHCLVSIYGDTHYISDVSTNGTMINGHKILKNQPVSICDGDVISLGQYEIGVSLELVTTSQDIAADIAPERVSNDPLINLGEAMVEEVDQSGVLEDLFMETKQQEVDSHDPVAHLNFSMQKDDDYLIKDVDGPEQAKSFSIESTRQMTDDSFSIHSEFDLPSLIPEDWFGGDSTSQSSASESESTVNLSTGKSQSPKSVPKSAYTMQPETVAQPKVKQTLTSTQAPEAVGQKWEEVTQPFTPSSHQADQPEQSQSDPKVGLFTSEPAESKSLAQFDDISQAFFEGLGINNSELIRNDTSLFRQMGTCLRLCMDNLQKDLREVEALKDEPSANEPAANLAELMLTLDSQNLLSPNELIEQMLDELNDHQVMFNRALNGLLVEQSRTNDPEAFANERTKGSLFKTKSRLWTEYLDFYASNRRQFNEGSLNGLIKKNYNKALKGNHA
ncbi:FHA domain-containing protein [Vibrio sp. JPW-9-11-11]|uniref:type VI secretion system-associated FHA domain protein n=1 Tax=Vibrio sp. JPW-9-11-11 TaxID=1416532 RepID=UPI001594410C|nr:type VI secretion system-associated FHA domain protein [Vibrio sp. JPW-9-11-11]NVD06243.1 FHA domain-containing protein [Vibrio sp. JPW-9-11-11]